MFKMKLNDQGDITTPNKVTLTSVQITNVFYALNSIVGLTPVQGIVSIKDCVFNRLLMCGGIIKSYYREVG